MNLPANIQTRPIVRWPSALTPDGHRRSSPFFASWRQTMELLDRELRSLGAERVVLQVAMTEADFRIDGLPRANARASHPGVILTFDTPDRGRLEFATDIFRTWEDNLRGIALGLEALRKVDRYGITRGDAQYAGFKALPKGDDGAFGMYSTEDARAFLGHAYDGDLKRAIRATHPDRNPDTDTAEFRKVMRAKELIEG